MLNSVNGSNSSAGYCIVTAGSINCQNIQTVLAVVWLKFLIVQSIFIKSGDADRGATDGSIFMLNQLKYQPCMADMLLLFNAFVLLAMLSDWCQEIPSKLIECVP